MCFCAGLAGYVFESCFLFFILSATIFMYYEENMSLNFLVTRHAQPIISIPEITPSLLYLYNVSCEKRACCIYLSDLVY